MAAWSFVLGKISLEDRSQRLLLGVALIALNLIGFRDPPAWNQWLALALQLDLVLTAVFGWCPAFWLCRIAQQPRAPVANPIANHVATPVAAPVPVALPSPPPGSAPPNTLSHAPAPIAQP